MELWSVMARFEEDQRDDLRVMTLRIILTDGEAEIETARVVFRREYTENPEVELGDALEAERAKAESIATVVNEMLDEEDRRRAEATYETRERVRKILGQPAD